MGPAAEADIEAGEQTRLIAGPPYRDDKEHRRRRRALLVAGPVCAAFLALDLALQFGGSLPPEARSASVSKAAAAGISPCRAELQTLCGGEKPGADCLNCTAYHHKSLDPRDASSLYWCEQWDIDAFCRPEGAPAAQLAPVQQEESREPTSVEEFVLDSFAVCRRYGFAIGPAYIMLVRAGLTALFLAWLSVLPQPLGSGEPSVPGTLAVVVGVGLVARSLYASLQILFIFPVPEFADTWYRMYEIKWWVALQHPAFGQACSVLMHKYFAWISTWQAWRRKAARWDRELEEDKERIRRGEQLNAVSKFKPQTLVEKAIGAGEGSETQTRVAEDEAASPSSSSSEGESPNADRCCAWTPKASLTAEQKKAARREKKKKLKEAAARREKEKKKLKEEAKSKKHREDAKKICPPRPPGESVFFLSFLFDVAEAIKPPRQARLGKNATIILQLSLLLAFVNFSIIGLPLAFTHLLPSVLLALPVFFVGYPQFSWWRATVVQLGDSVLAGGTIAGAGALMAWLKQSAAECVDKRGTVFVETEDWARDTACINRLGFSGVVPNHPRVYATRAMFVKGLSLLSALFTIFFQDATSQVILFRFRDPTRFYLSTAFMGGALGLLYLLQRLCNEPGITVLLLLLALVAGKGCSYIIAPMVYSPAEIFDARQTCAFEQCALHDFGRGVVGKIEGYFELRQFVTAAMHSVSPVACYYDIDYQPPNWVFVAAVFIGITGVSYALYHVIKMLKRFDPEKDSKKEKGMRLKYAILEYIRFPDYDLVPDIRILSPAESCRRITVEKGRITVAKGEHAVIACNRTGIRDCAAQWRFKIHDAHGPDLSGCMRVGVVLGELPTLPTRPTDTDKGKDKDKEKEAEDKYNEAMRKYNADMRMLFQKRGSMLMTGKGKVKRDGGPEPKAIVVPAAFRTGDTLRFLLDMDALTFTVSINDDVVAVFQEIERSPDYRPAALVQADQGADIVVEFLE
eukprot:TRINITY_DN11736_c0_g3_i1.p1 TRINITY_DN11736_c0_g3~~TRINITY_DN11736_c0_g3_i1.p1  ORF type:complete len:999 (+),score=247.23 TRINITY_DN11736_c0_g3_i1:83-2998(+)